MSVSEKVFEKVTEAAEAVVTTRVEMQLMRENVRAFEERVDRRLKGECDRMAEQLRDFDGRLRKMESQISELRGLFSTVMGDAIKGSVLQDSLARLEAQLARQKKGADEPGNGAPAG